jgi:hypothetical protein
VQVFLLEPKNFPKLSKNYVAFWFVDLERVSKDHCLLRRKYDRQLEQEAVELICCEPFCMLILDYLPVESLSYNFLGQTLWSA